MRSKTSRTPASTGQTEHGVQEGGNPPPDIPSSSGEDSVEEMQLSDKEASATDGAPRNCDKYNLRRSSVRARVQTEQTKQQPKQRKGKTRPPPLSKYRRRTANARERSRMAEINEAFDKLKQALPEEDGEVQVDESTGSGSKSNNKTKSQPTKATVLKLAIDYIAALRDILGYNAGSSSCSGSSSSNEGSGGSTYGSSSSSSGGDVGDPLSDDLGSDAASSTTPGGSGDEESLMSSDLDASGMISEMDTGGDLASEMDSIVMEDLDFFDSSLAADFSPDLGPDFTATLSPEEEVCLQLVTSVL